MPGYSQAFPQAGVQKYAVSYPPSVAPHACLSAIAQGLWPVSQRHLSRLSVTERQTFVNLHVSGFALTGGIRYVYSALAVLWHGETQDCFPSAPFLQQGQDLTVKL